MKKQLLKESEIRKLMKFAKLGALSDRFVTRLDEVNEMEPVEEGLYEVDGPPGDEDEVPADVPVGDVPMADEPVADEPVPDEPVTDELPPEEGEGEEPLESKLTTLVDAVKAFLPPEEAEKISVAAEPGTVGDVEPEAVGVGDEEDLAAADVGDVEVTDDEEEVPPGPAMDESVNDGLVNEVARRVARRLRAIN